MKVREADCEDATAIHALGCKVPELAVGGVDGGFPSRDDLEDIMFDGNWWALEDDAGIIWGFCCVQINDSDVKAAGGSACLVYLYIEERQRRHGYARMLWEAVRSWCSSNGIDHLYTWANPNSGVVEFFERQGFSKGKPCVWMDIDLDSSAPVRPAASPQEGKREPGEKP